MKRIINYAIILLSVICAVSCSSKRKSAISITEMQENVQKALDNDDYASAYNAVDLGRTGAGDEYAIYKASFALNEKILKQEITSLIDTDEDGKNAARIIYAITERSKYNDPVASDGIEFREKEQLEKMYGFAIALSESLAKEKLTENLNRSLKKVKEKE